MAALSNSTVQDDDLKPWEHEQIEYSHIDNFIPPYSFNDAEDALWSVPDGFSTWQLPANDNSWYQESIATTLSPVGHDTSSPSVYQSDSSPRYNQATIGALENQFYFQPPYQPTDSSNEVYSSQGCVIDNNSNSTEWNEVFEPSTLVPFLPEGNRQQPPYQHSERHQKIKEETQPQISSPLGSSTGQFIFINTFPDSGNIYIPLSQDLSWSPSSTENSLFSEDPLPIESLPRPKRNPDFQAVKRICSSTQPQKSLSDLVAVFETAPGALASVKKRKKLDAPVRKAAKDVRRAGACHQCRFRKRTCNTGTPCGTCLKHGTDLLEIRCQRESPFVGKNMYQYFEHSSTKRVLTFDVHSTTGNDKYSEVIVDGVGRISLPLRLKARQKPLSGFSTDAQARIRQAEVTNDKNESPTNSSPVILLEDSDSLAEELERWAANYTSQFISAAGPQFYSTTMAQIIGQKYVEKGLPEADLVKSMLRVASLAFVLRAGVNVLSTSNKPPLSPFRTVQARVDTILYERLKLAMTDLYQRLQTIIFRTAGSLNRDQVYPVALVLWQLIRILSIGASHLSNIVERFQSKAYAAADYQLHGLKLLVSTHLALFRSSCPLLFDFQDKFNQNLLGGDGELIALAMRMQKVVLDFKARGFPDLKGSIGWKKEYFDMFRRVYDGL